MFLPQLLPLSSWDLCVMNLGEFLIMFCVFGVGVVLVAAAAIGSYGSHMCISFDHVTCAQQFVLWVAHLPN